MTKSKRRLAGLLAVATFAVPGVAIAHPGWDCSFEGSGSNPARYISHLEIHGRELVEPHWPAATAYRILVDDREFLIAARAYVVPPTFRGDARAMATVVTINKINGRLRRTTGESGGAADRIETGVCDRR
jgi:hypothetical protein